MMAIANVTETAQPAPDDFSGCDFAQLAAAQGWQAQYKLIIGWGREVAPKPWLRSSTHLIAGCEVSAWLAARTIDGRRYYDFDSDSRVINGLAALLLAPLQGQSPQFLEFSAIVAPLASLNIARHLTPTRNNGLAQIAQALARLSQS